LASSFFRNLHLLWLTVVLLVVAGGSALLTMPRLEDPRIVNRTPIIITAVPGASAERVETLVTEPIEDELQDIGEIKDLSATSRAGVSIITVELVAAVGAGENERIFSKIRDRLGDVGPRLPPEAQSPILEDQRDPAAFTLLVAVGGRGDGSVSLNLLNRLAEDLSNRLQRLPGTEIVELFGAPDEEITVALDRTAAAELGLSPAAVAQRLALADSEEAAGVLRPPGFDIAVEVDGAFDSLSRIAAVPVATAPDGAVLRLRDIATTERDFREPPNQIALADGERVIFVAARMKGDAQVDGWAADARRVVEDYRAFAGGNVGFEIVFDQSTYTVERLLELAGNLGLGAFVVVLVVLVTMGWRAGLIVGMQLPLVALGSLYVIQMAGGALHQMSIFGMIIALGLLVDNAIVMTDHVTRALRAGKSPDQAVREAQSNLFLPLLASTITTVLAFAPIPLLPGSPGDFVGWIGGGVIVAILLSFLTAQTVVPALAARFVSKGRQHGWLATGVSWPSGVRAFEAALAYGLRRPLFGMLVAVSPALLGFALAPSLGNQFFPLVDRNMFDIRIWLPQSASLDRTRALVDEVDAHLHGLEEVRQVTWLVGASHPPVYYNLIENQDRSPHYAQGEVLVGTAGQADRLVRTLQRDLDAAFPEARIVLREYGQGPPVSADIQFRLFGRDVAQLQSLGERMRLALQEHEQVLHTRMTAPRAEPKLWVVPDEDAVRFAGLGLSDVSAQLRAALDGATGGAILENLAELPVRVRYADALRGDLAAIASAPIVRPGPPAADAGAPDWTPLPALASVELRPETPALSRFDRLRVNTVEAFVVNQALPITVGQQVLDRLAEEGFSLPRGVTLEQGGAAEQNTEAIGNLLVFVPSLSVLMVGALILIFRSLVKALILISVAGLCFGLAMLTTWAMSFPVSFNTILGTLGLIGIGLNDSIVVLTEIRREDDGSGRVEAIVKAVTNVLRHVTATTLTTIGGFLPLLLFIGGDFWPSLAIVLAGGVAGATLLSIGFVPAAYALAARLTARAQPIHGQA
jgi:multidrug efflux pump subunit AcrB